MLTAGSEMRLFRAASGHFFEGGLRGADACRRPLVHERRNRIDPPCRGHHFRVRLAASRCLAAQRSFVRWGHRTQCRSSCSARRPLSPSPTLSRRRVQLMMLEIQATGRLQSNARWLRSRSSDREPLDIEPIRRVACRFQQLLIALHALTSRYPFRSRFRCR